MPPLSSTKINSAIKSHLQNIKAVYLRKDIRLIHASTITNFPLYSFGVEGALGVVGAAGAEGELAAASSAAG